MARTTGQERRRPARVGAGVARSASSLLGSRPPADPGDIPAAWMADLHHPDLVISRDYIGPDRRSSVRTVLSTGHRPPAAHGRLGQAVVVAVTTTLLVVPLTLMATGGGSPVSPVRSATPPARATAARTAAPGRRGPPTRGPRAGGRVTADRGTRTTARRNGPAAARAGTGRATAPESGTAAARASRRAERSQARLTHQAARGARRAARAAARGNSPPAT